MSLEIRCPGCGRTLRIGEEHAGKQVRCPACQQISVAPLSSFQSAAPVTLGEPPLWHLQTPEGQTYGPISWQEAERWAGEGRVSAECQLAQSASGPWRPAGELFPHLALAAGAKQSPVAPTTYPWTTPAPPAPIAAGLSSAVLAAPGAIGPTFVAPHRGGLILVLGLLGFVVNCPIFSLMAWTMGSRDLTEMRSGRMDRRGEGLTQAGQILGMILSLLWLIVGGLALVVVLIAVAGN